VRKQKQRTVLEELLVEDYAAEGKSLARVDGKVIFIDGAVPGDIVDVQLSKNKKDWAEGQVVRIRKYSEQRVQPFCSHFGVCGGCQWQMLPYERQLFYKQKQVSDNLTRIAKVELPEMLPIIGADQTTHYRNKIEYTFGTKTFIPSDMFRKMKEENVNFDELPGGAGFHVRGFFDKVVEIDTCYLQDEPTNLIRKMVAEYAIERNLPFYDVRKHQGWLRNMFIRNSTIGELMVNIVFGFEDENNRKALLDLVLKQFPQITTLLYTINTKHNDSLFDLYPQVYSGNGSIIEKLEDFEFKISPKSFFQTNTKQAEKLYQVTREFAELDGTQTVYDLYCGTGSIGIFVSKLAKRLVGVEMVAEAIEDAKENAALNQLDQCKFFAGDVIDICDDAFLKPMENRM